MDPYETLFDIEQSCKTNAVTIPKQIASEKDWIGVVFKIEGFNFVCPMEAISEVIRWPELTGLPSSKSWFRGTANLRGKILCITDLEGFITGKNHPETESSRIIIIKFEKSIFGFSVEQVLGIEKFFTAELKPAASLSQIKDYLPFVQGAFEQNGVPWILLNFSSIILSPEFYHILSYKMEVA